MNALHIDLLIALRAPDRYGLALDALLTDMRRGRHRELTEPELLKALRDLADKGLAISFTSATGSARWRITYLGKAALIEDGL